ncbi:GNAT family N-acetyltransferase [Micromonospora tulbaghiae]|uniref:GNAT family N-acetyltransferase n=1 Tax=Micromonospora TaxID=1873 RepID=UPI0033E93E7B
MAVDAFREGGNMSDGMKRTRSFLGEITVRRFRSADEVLIEQLDSSFTTNAVFEVVRTHIGFGIRERMLSAPIVKHFPDEDVDKDVGDTDRFVAVDQHGVIRGVIELSYEEWHRRLIVENVVVDRKLRGRGVVRHLMNTATQQGLLRDARVIWLEVTNINAPAIRAYRRIGFDFCGLDASLYRGTASEGEIALFMCRELDEGAGSASSVDARRNSACAAGSHAPPTFRMERRSAGSTWPLAVRAHIGVIQPPATFNERHA